MLLLVGWLSGLDDQNLVAGVPLCFGEEEGQSVVAIAECYRVSGFLARGELMSATQSDHWSPAGELWPVDAESDPVVVGTHHQARLLDFPNSILGREIHGEACQLNSIGTLEIPRIPFIAYDRVDVGAGSHALLVFEQKADPIQCIQVGRVEMDFVIPSQFHG